MIPIVCIGQFPSLKLTLCTSSTHALDTTADGEQRHDPREAVDVATAAVGSTVGCVGGAVTVNVPQGAAPLECEVTIAAFDADRVNQHILSWMQAPPTKQSDFPAATPSGRFRIVSAYALDVTCSALIGKPFGADVSIQLPHSLESDGHPTFTVFGSLDGKLEHRPAELDISSRLARALVSRPCAWVCVCVVHELYTLYATPSSQCQEYALHGPKGVHVRLTLRGDDISASSSVQRPESNEDNGSKNGVLMTIAAGAAGAAGLAVGAAGVAGAVVGAPVTAVAMAGAGVVAAWSSLTSLTLPRTDDQHDPTAPPAPIATPEPVDLDLEFPVISRLGMNCCIVSPVVRFNNFRHDLSKATVTLPHSMVVNEHVDKSMFVVAWRSHEREDGTVQELQGDLIGATHLAAVDILEISDSTITFQTNHFSQWWVGIPIALVLLSEIRVKYDMFIAVKWGSSPLTGILCVLHGAPLVDRVHDVENRGYTIFTSFRNHQWAANLMTVSIDVTTTSDSIYSGALQLPSYGNGVEHVVNFQRIGQPFDDCEVSIAVSNPLTSQLWTNCILTSRHLEENRAIRHPRAVYKRSVFISHRSRESVDTFRLLVAALGENFDVFEPVRDLRRPSEAEMRERVRQSDIVLVVLSPGYFNSPYCRAEADEAMQQRRVAIPVYDGVLHLHDTVMGWLDVETDPPTRNLRRYVYSGNIVRVNDPQDQDRANRRLRDVIKQRIP